MDIKHGIAVSPGVAFGPAFVLDTERFRIPEKIIKKGSYPDEIARLRAGLSDAAGGWLSFERFMERAL